MSNVTFRQDTNGYTLVLKASIFGNRIVHNPNETTFFFLNDCSFYYDLCFVDGDGPAQVTINNIEYSIDSPLWQEIADVVGPYSAMEIECQLLQHGNWIPQPNTSVQ